MRGVKPMSVCQEVKQVLSLCYLYVFLAHNLNSSKQQGPMEKV